MLQHIICTCAQFLSELNIVMPLSEENQQHLNEIKRSDYRRPSFCVCWDILLERLVRTPYGNTRLEQLVGTLC